MMIFLPNCLGLPVALATEPVDKNTVPTKHYHFPFVNVDIAKHKDGGQDVDVKAPFTKVHNPAGPDNAQVKAPFTKVDHAKNDTVDNVKVPSTNAQTPTGKKQQK